MRALILEDNRELQIAINERLRDRFPFLGVEFFDASAKMNAFMANDPLGDIAVISLDHDLEMLAGSDGRWIDAGTGLDVVHRLTERFAPLCPVVVHTSNSLAGDEMVALLATSRWTAYRVAPFGDLEWIDAVWFPAIRNAIVDFAPREMGSIVRA